MNQTITCNAIRKMAEMHEDLTSEAMIASSVEDQALLIAIGQVQTQMVTAIKRLIRRNQLENWWRNESGFVNADVNIYIGIY